MDERRISFLCLVIVLAEIVCEIKGLKCRVDNDSKSVEDFEDMVRVCLRSPISSQDKAKNKNIWNRNKTNNKQSNKGKFGKDSEEYDDYDDDYGDDSKTDKKTQNKTMNNKGTKNKNNEGGIKLGSRFRRTPQYNRRGNGYNDYDMDNSNDDRYMVNSMMQGRGGYGYNDNNRGYNSGRMNDNSYREGGNNGYIPMGGYGNYKAGRYQRSAQYSPSNNWDEAGQNDSNRQRNRQNGYGNRGNSRDRYDNNGRPNRFGNNGGSYSNNGGSYGNNDRGYSNGGYGNSFGGNKGGYGFYDNRWPGDNSPQGTGNNNRNSSKDSKNLSSPLKNVQPCVIHCILRQKKMLDDDSTPDKNAVISVMTKNIKERELKEFIQDSVTECFDNIESDDIDGKCDMSKSLLMCLEEKGKQNCEDWDNVGPTTNPNKWFINSYNRPPNPPRSSSSWS